VLKDYAKYLEDIRDGLIQHGVIFPEVVDILNIDYTELFHLGEQLSDLIYLYSIMVCSGNMPKMFLPLDSTYKGHVREEAFEEFKSDILPILREQYGDNCHVDDIDIDSVVTDDSDCEPEEWVNEDTDDSYDLFESEDEESEQDVIVSQHPPVITVSEDQVAPARLCTIPDIVLSMGISPIETAVIAEETPDEDISYVPHGVDLFTVVSTKPAVKIEYVDHGVDLFTALKIPPTDVEYVSHGVDLLKARVFSNNDTGSVEDSIWDPEEAWEVEVDDDADDGSSVEVDSDGFEVSDEADIWVEDEDDVWEEVDSWGEDDEYDEGSDMGFADAPIEVDEDGFEIADDDCEVDSDGFEVVDEDELEVDSDGFEVADEDFGWTEDDTDEDGFEEVDEVEGWSAEDEGWEDEGSSGVTVDENGFEVSDEDVWVDDDSSVIQPVTKPTVNSASISQRNNQESKVSTPSEPADIVDSVQSTAEAALTGAKKFIVKLFGQEE
jgi:hypothetical protein